MPNVSLPRRHCCGAKVLTAAVLLVLLTCRPSASSAGPISLRELDAASAACGGALVKSNPLKGLKELQKVHHSWPIPANFLHSSDASFIDGVMHDYVRITGACSLSLEGLNRTLLNTCAEICDAVAAARTGPRPTITVNYSPWYHEFPGNDPTVAGPPEVAELVELEAQLANLKAWLPSAGSGKTKLGAVLYDSEKFHYSSHDTDAFKTALTRKHDLIWNATRNVFPNVRIELYDRGGVEKWDTSPVSGPPIPLTHSRNKVKALGCRCTRLSRFGICAAE